MKSLALLAFLIALPVTGLAQTTYTFPKDVHWTALAAPNGKPASGATTALLRGKDGDRCGQLYLMHFPDGFAYPWHVNGGFGIYTVLKGTLVIGFDKQHAAAKERALPAGTVMQGLATEPHYGRAIGDTIFQVYVVCNVTH